MDETRDLAVKAITVIEQHIATCDRRYEEWSHRQEKTLEFLKEINGQMTDMKSQIDEARGAGKMAKFITHGVSAVMGLAGGLSSHFVIK